MKRVIYYPIYAVVYITSLLPLRLLYAVAHLLYFVSWRILSYRKEVVIQNITRSFPDMKYGTVNRVAKGFLLHFCCIMAEWLKSFSISKKVILERITFDTPIPQKGGRDLFLVMGHYGNWEMTSAIPLFDSRPVYAIYKRQSSHLANWLSCKMRERFGVKLLESKEAAKFILSNRTPSIYIIIGDQSPPPSSKRTVIFMNQLTRVYEGIERLSIKKGGDVYYLETLPSGNGKYHFTLKPINTSEDITAQFYHHLSDSITSNPQYWLWSHRRWKH